jgi:hypothetical protein
MSDPGDDTQLDPDADPANLPSPPDTSGTPPKDVPDTASVQEDPEDDDDPDADPDNLGSSRRHV